MERAKKANDALSGPLRHSLNQRCFAGIVPEKCRTESPLSDLKDICGRL